MSTIIHGSENAARPAGDPRVSAIPADWAEAHPGQVVRQGIA